MTDQDVRDLLERMAAEEPTPFLDPEPLTHRARRRAARTVVVGAVGVAAAIAVLFAGVAEIRTAPAPIPADTPEQPSLVPLPFEFLDGEVTFAAAPPWNYSWVNFSRFEGMDILDGDSDEERLTVVADPLPVERGRRQGPAVADAEELALRLRSDPDLEASEPVSVSVGGRDALRMDVVAAPGASGCATSGLPQAVTPDDGWPGVDLEQGHRMRLYLLDLPEGSSARILAIAISAPEADFERVLGGVAPILDSFGFHAP